MDSVTTHTFGGKPLLLLEGEESMILNEMLRANGANEANGKCGKWGQVLQYHKRWTK
jgi:hypothetical protein